MGSYSLLTLVFFGLRYAFSNPAPLEELTINFNLRDMPKDGEITEYETFDEAKEMKAGQIVERKPVLIGGLDENEHIILQEEFFEDGEWKDLFKPLTNTQQPRSGMGAAFLNNDLYIAGGQDKKKKALRSVLSRTLTDKWNKEKSSLHFPRAMNTLTTIETNFQGSSQKTLMVTGGTYKGQDMSSSEIRIPTSSQTGVWTVTQHNMKRQRSGHAAVWFNERLYVLGGNIESSQSTEYFNPTDSTWNEGPPMNEQRTFHSATVLDGSLYVCGGEKYFPDGKTEILLSCEVGFVLGQGFVTSVANMPVARSQFAMLTVENVIWAIGGYNSLGVLASVEVYNSGTNTWTKGPQLRTPRRQFGAAIVEMTRSTESAYRNVNNSTV